MFRCEACGKDMGKMMSQCPLCSSWQVGAVTPRRTSSKPRQASDPSQKQSQDKPERGAPISLTEDQKWARATLGKIGFLWGTDVEGKLHSVAMRRAERLNPKPERRTARHSVSAALFVASFSLGIFEPLEVLGVLGIIAWLVSISLHVRVAIRSSNERSSAINELATRHWKALKGELGWARRNLLAKGPFGAAKNPPPNPEPDGVTDEQAEHLCAKWLSHLGEEKVQVTRVTSDGGIDILSSRCVAQVKNYAGSVGVVAVRELVGVASVDGRLPVFFTSGDYTKAALDFAEQANVYLFRYDAEAGTLDAKSSTARKALSAN